MSKLTPLDELYLRLLGHGLVIVRNALTYNKDPAWAEKDAELLHNVPTLVGEANVKRHQYFWEAERTAYLDWLRESGHEDARSSAATYYEPVWAEMEPIIQRLLQQDAGS